jgi:hypothetical protein
MLRQHVLPDWTATKKADHDLTRYGIAAKIEERFINQYCHKLLRTCESMRWIRSTLLEKLQVFFNIHKGRTSFTYLDGIKVEKLPEPGIKVESVKREKAFTDDYNKDRQTLLGFLNKLESSSIAHEKPWDMGLNKDIAHSISKLEKVSCISERNSLPFH